VASPCEARADSAARQADEHPRDLGVAANSSRLRESAMRTEREAPPRRERARQRRRARPRPKQNGLIRLRERRRPDLSLRMSGAGKLFPSVSADAACLICTWISPQRWELGDPGWDDQKLCGRVLAGPFWSPVRRGCSEDAAPHHFAPIATLLAREKPLQVRPCLIQMMIVSSTTSAATSRRPRGGARFGAATPRSAPTARNSGSRTRRRARQGGDDHRPASACAGEHALKTSRALGRIEFSPHGKQCPR